MKRSTLPALILAAALPVMAQTSAIAAEPVQPRIVVSGEGEASVAPDMAVLQLGVTQQAATAREALDASNKAMADIIALMKAEGVADRDLQTANFSVNPVYSYPKQDAPDQTPKIVGYQVSNTLTVRVRDLAKVGPVLDKSVTSGVNQGGSITFTNDDPAATVTQARTRAVKDAMAKAQTLAEAAGVSLGKIIEITEQTSTPQPMPMAMKSRDAVQASAVPVQGGENAYNVTVNVTFELGQK
ncbi:MAG: SIMPL domain-containing protein [Mesorhizobium sp.]